MAVEWRDEAIVLAGRPHGETSLLVSVLSRTHGRHMGLVRGGVGKAARGLWQPGNRLHVTWKARLADHLGTLSGEMADALAARVLGHGDRLAVLAAICAVAEAALPEREAFADLFEDTAALLALTADPEAPALADLTAAYVRWEMGVLADLGFGLDLTACAATGATEGLVYVSPRTGRAVSAAPGAPWHDRLLPLPAFLVAGEASPGVSAEVARAGLRLTGHFLDRHVFVATRSAGAPPARARLTARLEARGDIG
ncbi:DNA repair protein RecO [Roseospira navarrensis]|uniref:DNA repair protein RecO n=1 Tax=Roseospira navarrensis TaxID=140058 RepID=A0A7X1ZEB7_9PROT|nr:DNA repair protein RecO [Roseospira navarrensis]MQX36753.1 DNA repair protein RecO [Roseospira navarrensis]